MPSHFDKNESHLSNDVCAKIGWNWSEQKTILKRAMIRDGVVKNKILEIVVITF